MQKRSFFLAVSFPKKAFVFPNNRIAHLPPGLVQENFSKRKNKTAEKIMGQCFPLESKVTLKN